MHETASMQPCDFGPESAQHSAFAIDRPALEGLERSQWTIAVRARCDDNFAAGGGLPSINQERRREKARIIQPLGDAPHRSQQAASQHALDCAKSARCIE